MTDSPGRRSGALRALRALRSRLARHWLVTGATLVVIAAIAVPVSRVMTREGGRSPLLTGAITTGHGRTACRQLEGGRFGTALDTRTIDGKTAAAWLHDIRSPVDPQVIAQAHVVTLCVLARGDSYQVSLTRPGQPALLASTGDEGRLEDIMVSLDDLRTGGAATVHAAFTCRAPDAGKAIEVSTTLPPGATGVRLCGDEPARFVPDQVLTSHVGALVRAVNASPVVYIPPNVFCSAPTGQHHYHLVFRYPTGVRVLHRDVCGWFSLGSVQREDGAPTLELRTESLLAKQLGSSPGSVAPPRCPPPLSGPSASGGDLTNLIAARFCPSGTTGHGAVLSASQVERLRGGLSLSEEAGFSKIGRPCDRPPSGWDHMTLVDAWRHSFTVALKCDDSLTHWSMTIPDGSHSEIRSLRTFPSTQRLLQQLVTTTTR